MKDYLLGLLGFAVLAAIIIGVIVAIGGPSTVHCVQRVNSTATCYDSP